MVLPTSAARSRGRDAGGGRSRGGNDKGEAFASQLLGQSLFPAAADPSSPCWRKCITLSSQPDPGNKTLVFSQCRWKKKAQVGRPTGFEVECKNKFSGTHTPQMRILWRRCRSAQSGSRWTGDAVNGWFLSQEKKCDAFKNRLVFSRSAVYILPVFVPSLAS